MDITGDELKEREKREHVLEKRERYRIRKAVFAEDTAYQETLASEPLDESEIVTSEEPAELDEYVREAIMYPLEAGTITRIVDIYEEGRRAGTRTFRTLSSDLEDILPENLAAIGKELLHRGYIWAALETHKALESGDHNYRLAIHNGDVLVAAIRYKGLGNTDEIQNIINVFADRCNRQTKEALDNLLQSNEIPDTQDTTQGS